MNFPAAMTVPDGAELTAGIVALSEGIRMPGVRSIIVPNGFGFFLPLGVGSGGRDFEMGARVAMTIVYDHGHIVRQAVLSFH